MMRAMRRPLLFVISGPSGSGKGTALKVVGEEFPKLVRAATFTTRSPRPGEVPGRDYEFLSQADFDAKIAGGEIFEFTQPYRDYQYGSPTTLLRADADHDLLVELDFRGMLRVRALSARRVVSIFLVPPQNEVLAQRIGARHPETNLEARMASNVEQSETAWSYDYVLVNAEVEQFRRDLVTVVSAELLRRDGLGLLAALDDRLVKHAVG